MFISPGFQQQSVIIPSGKVAYAAIDEAFWQSQSETVAPADTPLVFLHGFGGGSSSYEWSQVYPAFAPQYRVFAPDLIGWGRSAHPDKTYRVEDYLDCIQGFLEAVCPQPAVVIASSLTGAMVARLAVAQPQRFKALILVAPTGLADFGNTDPRQNFIAQVLQIPLLDRALYWSAIATPDAIRAFLKQRQFANPDRVNEDMVSAYLASARQENAEYAALSFVRGDLSFDLAEYLPQLTVPTVILWGEQAQFTDVQTGARLAALNPDAIRTFVRLPNTGLTPQLEWPAVTIGLIKQALQQP